MKALDEHEFPRLKYVLISIDYHSLHTSSQGERNIWSYYSNGIKYKDTYYLLSNLSPFLWGYGPKVSLIFLKKKILNKNKILDLESGVKNTSLFYRGYLGYSGQSKKSFTDSAYKIRISNFEVDDVKNYEEVIADLEDLIVALKSKEITPILFCSPTYKEYNRMLNNSILSKNRLEIDKICSKYSLNYLDYMDDNRFDKNDFYNADHLNQEGAKKFSKILSNELNSVSK